MESSPQNIQNESRDIVVRDGINPEILGKNEKSPADLVSESDETEVGILVPYDFYVGAMDYIKNIPKVKF